MEAPIHITGKKAGKVLGTACLETAAENKAAAAEGVVGGYKKIEEGVAAGYKKIEKGAGGDR